MKALLSVPNQGSLNGRRDVAIIALLYDTGARIQEFLNLRVKDIRLEKPETVTLFGKGRKMRSVSIMEETAKIVESYMIDRGFIGHAAC
ncbi:MAG: tyrosine-type recombinase/integrase, partial [Oscillospiraceae bacterium]|nr:tyrosine-type recombinase/integrase [Oscillospiraceae bacterium]